jgi:hypothetical protein
MIDLKSLVQISETEFWRFVKSESRENLHPCLIGSFPFVTHWKTKGGIGELWGIGISKSRLTGDAWKHGENRCYFISPKFYANYSK